MAHFFEEKKLYIVLWQLDQWLASWLICMQKLVEQKSN